jgi:UDP-glucose 4-epimerase
MSKILVTGGAGFIGSHIVDELIKDNHEVTIIDNMSRGFKENVNPKAKLVMGKITDYESILDLFERNKFEYVFHLAAYSAVGLSHYTKRFSHQSNTLGSINLINASIINKTKCFVFLSSISVYGDNPVPFTEDMHPKPEEPYGISKYAVELELESSLKNFGLNYIIFRPYNVYGERQHIGDENRNVVGIFIRKFLQGEPLTIVGDGEQKHAFTHISDIAPIIARSPFNQQALNQIFNLGSEEISTIKQLAQELSSSFNIQPEIMPLPVKNKIVEGFSSIEKARKYLNFEPKISLKQGIQRMTEWAKKQGIKRIDKFEDLEIPKD